MSYRSINFQVATHINAYNAHIDMLYFIIFKFSKQFVLVILELSDLVDSEILFIGRGPEGVFCDTGYRPFVKKIFRY